MDDALLQDMKRLARLNPAARRVLVPMIRRRASWSPGQPDLDGREEVDLSWFEPGVKIQNPLDGVGEGSQVPPAKDHDGNPVEEEGDFEEEAVKKLAKDPIQRALYRANVNAERELVGVKDHLENHFQKMLGKPVRLASMALSLNADAGSFEALGQMKVAGKEHPFCYSGKYYGDMTYQTTWFHPVVVNKQARQMVRTAGEVRFIKDHGGDEKQWGWGSPGPNERLITEDYKFRLGALKPLAKTLRASLAALGHAMSAYATFSKIKSATISPDGALGGRGYITKVADMRRQYMNVVEALSSLTDTIHDEINAPHWSPKAATGPRERRQVKEILSDAAEIRQDPEGWAKGEEQEMDAEHKEML